MFKSSAPKSRLCYLVILQCLLLQQCLLQLNTSCEASYVERPMSSTSPDSEAKTSDSNNTGELVSALLQDDEPDGPGKSVASRLREAATLAIAPAKSYFQLIQRYNEWRKEYNKLQEEFGLDHLTDEPILRDAADVMRIEYAKVDQQMHKEACEATAENSTKTDKEINKEVENMDFIFRVIRLLIDRLEERLEMLKRGGIKAALDERLKEADAEAERQAESLETALRDSSVQEASDRLKRIATKSATGFLRKELLQVAQTLVLNSLVTYVMSTNSEAGSDATSMMSRIEPFLFLIGSANTGLLVSYFKNIRVRALFKILNYSVGIFTCKRDAEMSSNSSSASPTDAQLVEQEIADTNGPRE